LYWQNPDGGIQVANKVHFFHYDILILQKEQINENTYFIEIFEYLILFSKNRLTFVLNFNKRFPA